MPDYWASDTPALEMEKLIAVLMDAPNNPCEASNQSGSTCVNRVFDGNGLGVWDVVWGTYDGINDWLEGDHVRDSAHRDCLIHVEIFAGTTIRRIQAIMNVSDDTPRLSATLDLAHLFDPSFALVTGFTASGGNFGIDSGTVELEGPFHLYIYENSDVPPSGASAKIISVILDYTGDTTFGPC